MNEIIQIKIKLTEGMSSKEISHSLNVSIYSVKDIKRGKTWKHVQL